MAVSKVVKSNGDVIMDISQDNVNANNLLQGGTAHGSDGEAVQGAVIVPSSATITGAVNGTGALSGIPVNRKSCCVGNNVGGTSATPWYKVASRICNESYKNYRTAFYVQKGVPSHLNTLGILDIDIRTANNVIGYADIKWLISGSDIEPNKFAITVDTSTKECTLYAKCMNAYETYRFISITESSDYNYADNSSLWALYNDRTGISELPANTTVFYSTFADTHLSQQVNNNSKLSEVSDTAPYLYKPSEHDAVYDELVGGSVAWNQLVQNGNFESTSGWATSGGTMTTLSTANNILTISSTASINTSDVRLQQTINFVDSHKYLFTVTGYSSAAHNHQRDGGIEIYPMNTSVITIVFSTTKQTYYKVFNTAAGSTIVSQIRLYSMDSITSHISNLFCVDLTQMFGTTIADYVYNLEQSTAGSGIAWLKSYGFFTKGYYAYNAGGLISVNTSGKKVVSETTEITYPIQSTDLRGLYKLSGSKLYTDGDIYSADGQITRKYGIVDLGTLEWSYPGGDNNYFRADIPNIKTPNNNSVFNAINSRYVVVTWSSWYSNRINKTCGFGNDGRMYVTDTSYTDAATFKSSMSGVYLIYELATPTTVPAQPFISPQMVYRSGTEEYLDTRDVPIPVGGNRKYVDIPDWMVNEYFDDVRAETSTLKTISKLQQENEILRNALSQSTYLIPEGTIDIDSNTITDRTKCFYYIPNNLNSAMTIDENAFKGCANLINITLPVNVSSIEYAAFSGCKSLTNINLTNVAHIRDVAFFNCKGLTSITIPSSVISISDNAFRGCTNLTNITINKPQNSISGAPWEATNATVTWTG